MKRRYRIYCDTSFWNRLGDRDDFSRRRLSYHFLNRACARHLVLVSSLVYQEVEILPIPRKGG